MYSKFVTVAPRDWEVPLRIALQDDKSYDVNAMFSPRQVGQKTAWLAMKKNLRALPSALTLPARMACYPANLLRWLVLMTLHLVSLVLLPFFAVFGYSMKAYCLITPDEEQKLQVYQRELKQVYAQLAHIDDPDEYQRRLRDEIQRIKPL